MALEQSEGVLSAVSSTKDVELAAQELARQLIHPITDCP